MRILVLFLMFQIPLLSPAQNNESKLYQEAKTIFEGLDINDIKEDLIGKTVITKSVDPLREGYVRSWTFEDLSEFVEVKIISSSVQKEFSDFIYWNIEASFILEDSEKWIIEHATLKYRYSDSTRKLMIIKADTLEKIEDGK